MSCFFITLYFLSSVSCLDSVLQDREAVVMRIDQETVTAEELLFFLKEERTNVIVYFANKYQAPVNNGFWQYSFEDESPLTVVKNRAIEQLITVKVQQQLMQRYGVKSNTSFSEVLEEWTKTNQERVAAVANGQVVYGPVTYSHRNYFSHVFNTDVLRLKRALEPDYLTIPEAECRSYYQKNRSYFHFLNVSFEKVTLPLSAEEMLNQSLEKIKKFPGVFVEMDTLDEERKKMYEEEYEEIAEVIKNQTLGTCSRPIKTEKGWVFIKPMQRFLDPKDTYDQVRSDVLLQLQNEKYDQLIRQKINSARVEKDTDKIDAVCAAFVKEPTD